MNQQTNNSIRRNNQTTPRINNTSPPSSFMPSSRAFNTSSSSGGYSGSKVIGIIILVVVLILLVGACYWLYTFYSNRVFQTTVETEVMPDVKDAATNFSIGNGSIPSSNYSNEYSISMWLNIDNYTYNYGKEKIILRRGDKGDGNPEIVLDAKTNNLIVRLKLQNSSISNSLIVSDMGSATMSKFADIPKLPLQPDTPHTPHTLHTLGRHEPSDNYYMHGAFQNSDIQVATNSLDKVGNNVVDYPTIQYQQSNGCDNALTTLKPDNAMTIMIEQAARVKEGFKTDGGEYNLANIDTNRLSDNSAPLESRNIYNNEYFAQISGDEIQLNHQVSALKEGFDAVSDLTNACVDVMIDMCKLASAMQSQTNADNQVEAMNTAFQTVIDSLENTRNNSAITPDDINKVFLSSMDKLPDIMASNTTMTSLINNLQTNLAKLQSASAQTGANSVGFATIQSAINSKLSSLNCPLTLNGANEVEITTNFYEAFINMVKKSLYTYLNNMSAGLQKALPELAGNSSASFLIQNMVNPDPTVGTCIYRSIPLQKWVHVVVSVYNQVVDIFIDGQLASSCVLKAYPAISTSNVVITPDGGFAGKISRVIFSNTAMTVQHAKELYYAGPVASTGLLSMIPNWVWYGIIFLIIIGISYSVLI